MYEETSVGDLQTFFLDTIILYKKKPVYVNLITGDRVCKVTDLLSQKSSVLENPFEEFVMPALRIGMVNVAGGVVYMERTPVRKWQMGLSRSNVGRKYITHFSEGRAVAEQLIERFNCKAIGLAMLNKYPSLEEAQEQAIKEAGGYAFDKQFAVDFEQQVFYKTKRVGRNTGKGIKFDKGFEFLSLLIGGKHGTSLEAFKKAFG